MSVNNNIQVESTGVELRAIRRHKRKKREGGTGGKVTKAEKKWKVQRHGGQKGGKTRAEECIVTYMHFRNTRSVHIHRR